MDCAQRTIYAVVWRTKTPELGGEGATSPVLVADDDMVADADGKYVERKSHMLTTSPDEAARWLDHMATLFPDEVYYIVSRTPTISPMELPND